MQARGRGNVPPPVGLALDGDFGHRIDAVLALAMLNGFTSKGEVRRISLSTSRPSLKAAQLADVIAGFYRGAPAGGPGGGGVGTNPDNMIGMPEGGPSDDAPPLAAAVLKKAADGAPLYTSTIKSLLDTPESSVAIRNVLLAQQDGNGTIVLAGPATGLARILSLYRSGPQITAKVRRLVVALGSYPGGQADPSIKTDVAAARKLFAEWPTPLVAVGSEVGEALPYPGASIEADFSWSPAHPVADTYRIYKAMPYDAPAPALAALVHAIHPTADYFTLSDPGTITVLDDGRTQFAPSADGKHRYLIVDPAQKERVLALYKETVSAKPAPRPTRGRGPAPQDQQQQQQQLPPLQVPPPAPPGAKPPTP